MSINNIIHTLEIKVRNYLLIDFLYTVDSSSITADNSVLTVDSTIKYVEL